MLLMKYLVSLLFVINERLVSDIYIYSTKIKDTKRRYRRTYIADSVAFDVT